jgi:hypothetical protein
MCVLRHRFRIAGHRRVTDPETACQEDSNRGRTAYSAAHWTKTVDFSAFANNLANKHAYLEDIAATAWRPISRLRSASILRTATEFCSS